jgi:hypothetical protein
MDEAPRAPSALDAGGPDNFGYTWRDSRERGGPAFAWEDVRASGAPIALIGDDAISAALPLSFDFPLYGQSFRALRVATNGFVSFTSTSTAFSNTPLPDNGTGVPENLLAAFWDDLAFPTDPLAYFFCDAHHAVIQFQGVPRFVDASNPNTFEIVIDPSGGIEYRYLDMRAANLASATIGIQNATRDDGLEVAFDQAYVADSLAVHFTRPPSWLTVTPDTGRVAAGGALDLNVGFHAAGFFGGRYDGRIRLDGNDPLVPRLEVPARLIVDALPLLALADSSFDFGRVSIGVPRSIEFQLSNLGSDTLRVTKCAAGDPQFTVEPDRFVVPPFTVRGTTLSFAPGAVGPVAAALTLLTNDAVRPVRTLPLSGRGAEPPSASVAVSALHQALANTLGPRAASSARPLVIANAGGNDLIFHVHARTGPGVTAATPPVNAEAPKNAGEAKSAAGPQGTAHALGSGGPDAGGYRWLDSDEPGGPAFQWIDLQTIGQPLGLDGDDETSAPVALPFAFPFYGSAFDSIRVCTNGFASFTSALATYTNTPLPNAGSIVPENLLAVFWDDQDFRPASGAAQALFWSDSTRCVIEYLNVPHVTVGGPYTYEIVLHRGGDIDYQYLSMPSRTTEATIGIQNGDRSVGLQVVDNAAFVHDRLCVRFTRTPSWLAAAPDSGSAAPAGSDTVGVAFSSAGYPDGDYEGSIHLETNDPRSAVRDLPVLLHVGTSPARCHVTTRALALTSGDRTAHFTLGAGGGVGNHPGLERAGERLARGRHRFRGDAGAARARRRTRCGPCRRRCCGGRGTRCACSGGFAGHVPRKRARAAAPAGGTGPGDAQRVGGGRGRDLVHRGRHRASDPPAHHVAGRPQTVRFRAATGAACVRSRHRSGVGGAGGCLACVLRRLVLARRGSELERSAARTAPALLAMGVAGRRGFGDDRGGGKNRRGAGVRVHLRSVPTGARRFADGRRAAEFRAPALGRESGVGPGVAAAGVAARGHDRCGRLRPARRTRSHAHARRASGRLGVAAVGPDRPRRPTRRARDLLPARRLAGAGVDRAAGGAALS